MKKIFIIATILVLALGSCTKNFEDFNTDKKNPAVVPGEPLFSNAQKELSDYVNNTNVNINIFKLVSQYWTETTYVDESNYDLVTRNISSNIYYRMYLRVLSDLQESKRIISETDALDAAVKNNKLQIIEIMNVYAWAHLVNVFGSVPYTDALDAENVYPTYDKGADIYKDLFSRLNAALSGLDAGKGSFGSADLYYGGDVASWVKFGNSLKIRMGIMVADVDAATSKSAVEAGAKACFESNADDCLLAYASPNANQLYLDLVASGRHDFVVANTIVDAMNGLADPRMDAYFVDKFDVDTTDAVDMQYKGGEYGYSNSYSQNTHINDAIQASSFPGIMMTYTEVCFYLAEAAERGYSVGGTAEDWYNKGVESSFAWWGVGGASDYLAKADVAYSSAAGDWKEKIGVQSWIANYTRGITAYNNWRRLDYPILNIPEQVTDYSDIPVRFTFPINEQTLNADNYAAASSAIGGDNVKTRVFWDVN